MLAYAKGFGDLSAGWLRPFAVQGDFVYEVSVAGPRQRELDFAEVLMYSIPYLNRWVRHADAGSSLGHNLRSGFSRGALLGNLFPYVEFNAIVPVDGMAGVPSSSFRPGTLWMGKYAQISIAADIPLEGTGIAQRHVGASILLDWFLDEILPQFEWTPSGKHH